MTIDDFLKLALPAIAFFWFCYQALSGSYFATTSILLEATRDEKNPSLVIVKATIERGDNWLVEIVEGSDKYLKTTNAEDPSIPSDASIPSDPWEKLHFPRRYDKGNENVLRLGPKEKTETSIFINDDNGFFLTAQVEYFSVGWNLSFDNRKGAISFSKIYIPANTALSNAVKSI